MHLRRATVQDALAVESVRVASWRVAYRGIVSDAFLDELQVLPERLAALTARLAGTDPITFLAEHDGVPWGMAVAGSCRDDDVPDAWELYALYVTPDAWRRGVGTALLQACDDVRKTELLWVLEGNAQGRAFYEAHGFRADGTSKVLEVDSLPVEVRYRRS